MVRDVYTRFRHAAFEVGRAGLAAHLPRLQVDVVVAVTDPLCSGKQVQGEPKPRDGLLVLGLLVNAHDLNARPLFGLVAAPAPLHKANC